MPAAFAEHHCSRPSVCRSAFNESNKLAPISCPLSWLREICSVQSEDVRVEKTYTSRTPGFSSILATMSCRTTLPQTWPLRLIDPCRPPRPHHGRLCGRKPSPVSFPPMVITARATLGFENEYYARDTCMGQCTPPWRSQPCSVTSELPQLYLTLLHY